MNQGTSSFVRSWQGVRATVASNAEMVLPATTAVTALRKARGQWDAALALLITIDDEIDAVQKKIREIAADPELSVQARQQRITAAATAARAQMNDLSRRADAQLKTVLDGLRIASYPARPHPDDPAEETRVAGIKTDLRMVLDAEATDDLLGRLEALLVRAMGDGDRLLLWLLASTNWVVDYLTSRHTRHDATAWPYKVVENLRSFDDGATDTRTAYLVLSNPKRGIPALLTVINASLPRILEKATGSTGPFAPAAGVPRWTRISS